MTVCTYVSDFSSANAFVHQLNAGRLANEGHFSLDDRVAPILDPYFKSQGLDNISLVKMFGPDADRITIRQLATMRVCSPAWVVREEPKINRVFVFMFHESMKFFLSFVFKVGARPHPLFKRSYCIVTISTKVCCPHHLTCTQIFLHSVVIISIVQSAVHTNQHKYMSRILPYRTRLVCLILTRRNQTKRIRTCRRIPSGRTCA